MTYYSQYPDLFWKEEERIASGMLAQTGGGVPAGTGRRNGGFGNSLCPHPAAQHTAGERTGRTLDGFESHQTGGFAFLEEKTEEKQTNFKKRRDRT